MEGEVEAVDRLDEPDAARLKDVVGVGVFRPKALDEGEHKTHIADDKPVPRGLIARFEAAHELVVLLMGEFGQPRRIHAADKDLLQHTHLLARITAYVWERIMQYAPSAKKYSRPQKKRRRSASFLIK